MPTNMLVDRTSGSTFPVACSVQFGTNAANTINCAFDTNLIVNLNLIYTSVGQNVVAGGTQVKIVIDSSTQKFSNPVSAKDCGNWKVTTYNFISNKEWLVDTATASSAALKFTATSGTLTAGSVKITNSLLYITSNEQATYKFDITLAHSLPAFGKLTLTLPS